MNLLSLHGLGCGGDTISILNGEQPDVITLFKEVGINILWHHSLSLRESSEARAVIEDVLEGRTGVDIFVLEGAVPSPQMDYRFAGIPFRELVKSLASKAGYILAVGTCACFGGIPGAEGSPTEATGVQFQKSVKGGLLGPQFRTRSGLPVINLPGCPVHPDWFLETVFLISRDQMRPEMLNSSNMPNMFYNSLAHHGCPRNEFYEFKASAKEYGQMGCLFEFLGCRGTQCESDCNQRLWLGRTGSCTRGGFPCIACTSREFPQDGRFFQTEFIGDIPRFLPRDVPKAWYIGITGLSKLATPERLKRSATSLSRIYQKEEEDGQQNSS